MSEPDEKIVGPQPSHASPTKRRYRQAELRELRGRLAELETLTEASSILAKPGTFEHKAQQTLDILVQHMGVGRAVLRVPDKNADALRLVAYSGNLGNSSPIPAALSHGTLAWKAFSQQNTLLINDYPNHPDAIKDLKLQGVGSTILLPIKSGQKPLGILGFTHTQVGFFTPSKVKLIQAIANGLGSLIENAQLMESLVERTEELDRTNKDLDAFTYSVSHDLRAPLRAIDGFTRILEEDYSKELPSEAKRYLGLVIQNTGQMSMLLDDLLNLSRLTKVPIKKQEVDPLRLAREVWEDLGNQRKGRNIDVRIPNLPPCKADPILLRNVFTNLLSNSIKYTRPRDVAKVEVGYKTDPEMQNGYVFFVKDNGVGFEMKYADKLFTPFQRLHRAEEFEGTGVGLATVKRIIQRHGGRVWADGEVNKGATFYFTLEGVPNA